MPMNYTHKMVKINFTYLPKCLKISKIKYQNHWTVHFEWIVCMWIISQISFFLKEETL